MGDGNGYVYLIWGPSRLSKVFHLVALRQLLGPSHRPAALCTWVVHKNCAESHTRIHLEDFDGGVAWGELSIVSAEWLKDAQGFTVETRRHQFGHELTKDACCNR